MNTDLQRLRDEAEVRSRCAAKRGDRDSADCWERIALAIDEAIQKTKGDFCVLEHRTGINGLRV